MSRIPLLARLCARECPAFELAFRLEPIVQVTARLSSAFEVDFVGATLISSSRAQFPTETSSVPAWVKVAWGSVISILFGFDDILISLFPVIRLPLIVEARSCIRLARAIALCAKHESAGKSRLAQQFGAQGPAERVLGVEQPSLGCRQRDAYRFRSFPHRAFLQLLNLNYDTEGRS